MLCLFLCWGWGPLGTQNVFIPTWSHLTPHTNNPIQHVVSTHWLYDMLNASEITVSPRCISERQRQDCDPACHRPEWLPRSGTTIALESREEYSIFAQGSLPLHRASCTQTSLPAKLETDTSTSKSSLKPGTFDMDAMPCHPFSIPRAGISSQLLKPFLKPKESLLH
jgi:hypothetical protein